MRVKFKIFSLCLILQLPVIVLQNYAQNAKYKFDFYGHDEGLNAASICLAQDTDGFIWIGTWRGLFRFDGVQFKKFTKKEGDTTSLSDNNINSIAFDEENNLWVATNNGLNKFNIYSKTSQRFFHDSTNIQSLSDSYITTLCFDRENNLWIGTKTGGINRIIQDETEKNNFKFISYRNNPSDNTSLCNNSINSIGEYVKEGNSRLIIGTNHGLSILDKKTNRISNYYNNSVNNNCLPNNGVTLVHIDSSNQLWIGTNGGYISSVSFDEQISFENFYIGNKTQVENICEYKKDFLWIGTLIYGFAEFNKKSKTISSSLPFYENDFPYGSDINDMLIDKDNRVWIGTRWGLHKYDPNIKKFNYHYLSPSKGVWFVKPTCFVKDKRENLWVGTLGNGLVKLNSSFIEEANFTPNKNIVGSLSSIWITDMVISKSGTIWVGTDRGLDKYNPTANNFIHYTEIINEAHPKHLTNDFIYDLFIDNQENLWISSAGGVSKYRGDSFTHYLTSAEQKQQLGYYIGDFYQDTKGKFWLGSNSLYQFDAVNNKIKKYVSPKTNLSINHMVFSIVQDDYENYWVGTFGGLFCIQSDGTVNHFTTEDGLPNNITYGILKDKLGFLWIETFKGIIKLNPKDYSIERYYFEGDFLPDQFGAKGIYKDNDGNFYLGQPNRITHFNPIDINLNKNRVKIVITDLKISDKDFVTNKQFNGDEEVSLSYHENRLVINWAGIAFTNPDKVEYTYKFEGYNDEWTECGTERSATFANLNPGKYVFNIKAYNEDGVLNNEAAILKININSPLWATWWFRTIASIFLITLGYLIYRYRVNQLLQLERMRVQIASDLHDDVGSSLTKIAIHSEIIQNTEDKNKVTSSSAKIGSMSREIITSLSDIIWSIDARNDKVGDLIDRMRDYLDTVFATGNITTNFQTYGLIFENNIDQELRQNIYLIFKEAVNNAAKHSNATEVKISMTNDTGKFKLEISDNGKGIEFNDKSSHSHGLQNMKLRADRIGGELIVENKDGTKIILMVKEL